MLKQNSQCVYVNNYYGFHNSSPNDSCRSLLVTYIDKENLSMSIALADIIADSMFSYIFYKIKSKSIKKIL